MRVGLGDLPVDEAGDYEALPLAQLDVGLHLARRQRRDGKSIEGHGIGEVERGDFRFYVKPDGIVIGHDGIKSQPDAEFAELNRHRARVCSSL